VIELCGASLRRFQNTECRKFRLTRKAKTKCSDMRRFAILFFSFFLLLLFSDQNSMAQNLMGWPNFNTVPDTIKNGETKTQATRSKKKPLPQKQIVWQAWKDLRKYRYRTGSRYAGRGNWERYIIFESRENVHFSEISCGSAKAPDVSLSPSSLLSQKSSCSPLLPPGGNGILPCLPRQRYRNTIRGASPKRAL
jgi:hypothetical protein